MQAESMEFQHVNVKIFVDGDLAVDPARFIEVFHEWINTESLNELLIDVADYRHVPAGPGVLLIAHEADYSMDNGGGRWGLRYNRKAAVDGANADRFRQALQSAAKACGLLEERFANDGPLKFSRHEMELFINDRALAPNTTATFASCRPELEAFLAGLFGHGGFSMTHVDDPRARFGVIVESARPLDLQVLAGQV